MKLGGLGLIGGALCLALLIVLSITLLSGAPLYSYHENLVSNTNVSFQGPFLTISLNDTHGITIAWLRFFQLGGCTSCLYPASNNSVPIMVSIDHIVGTWLDSVRLSFSTRPLGHGVPRVWLSSAEEPLTPTIIIYHDQNDAVVEMPNTGPAGDSAGLFDLVVGGNGIIPAGSTYPLDVQVEMSLHESNYQGIGYPHTSGYPIIRQSFTGQVSLAFAIDSNGNLSKS